MANRGTVIYDEPLDTSVGDTIKASPTQYLLSVLLITMNERDSINKIMSNPDGYGNKVTQLNGIADPAKQTEMNSVRSSIVKGAPVYASWVNTIVKYTNELTNTLGAPATALQTVDCTYAYSDTIISKQKEPENIPITDISYYSDKYINTDGSLKTSVGVVDRCNVGDGTYKYYKHNTISPELTIDISKYIQIYPNKDLPANNPSGYFVLIEYTKDVYGTTNIDNTKVVNLCGNASIECSNRSRLYSWKSTSSAVDPGYVNICNNSKRQVVVNIQGSISAIPVPTVNKGDIIYASTFTAIATNLRLISKTLDGYTSWWNNGSCAKTCQTSCQRACMLSCQNCYGGTCHDQNCGGFS